MRRWLVILLLALLPLQFSWAAVAAYCGHETGARAQHLGHHAHAHAQAAQPDGEPDSAAAQPDAPAGFDVDCGQCHGSCASLPACAGSLAPIPQNAHRVMPAAGALRTLVPSPPERPQWLPLA